MTPDRFRIVLQLDRAHDEESIDADIGFDPDPVEERCDEIQFSAEGKTEEAVFDDVQEAVRAVLTKHGISE